MKRIAIIGSSGGNLHKQGGDNPAAMIQEISKQAESAGIEIGSIVFVGAASSMDGISIDTSAKLFTFEQGILSVSEEAKLEEINLQAKAADNSLANLIQEGKIDGMILLSCDPKNVNNASIKAAAEKRIPLAGTGGTSIADARSLGANVISASGTTGTTNRTRAIAFISAFATEWDLKYMPVLGSSEGSSEQGSVWKRINVRGIMLASMPGFIAMALALALSKFPGLSPMEDVFSKLVGILPVILAAIAAKKVSGLEEVGIVAGIVAGVLSVDGGIIGGLLAGILAGIFSYYIISFSFKKKFPATTANIAAGGLGGLAAGLIGLYLIAPVALLFGNGVKGLIEAALTYSPILAGAVAGLLIWPSIIGGVYHAAILPIVLLEMESTGFSFLGAIDMTGLVMVSAGITLANVIFPRQKGDAAAALPGFLINIGFGTFVEAAYPFMFADKIVFAGALVAAAVSGAFVGLFDVKGTAYVPSIVAPGLANEGNALNFLICMLIALAVSFAITAFANRISHNKVTG